MVAYETERWENIGLKPSEYNEPEAAKHET
jgi:hypothetical protein